MLELGCGASLLAGLTAAARGAHVVATDVPAVLPAACAAAVANAPLVAAGRGALRVEGLSWDEALAAEAKASSAAASASAASVPHEGRSEVAGKSRALDAAAAWLLEGGGPWAAAEGGGAPTSASAAAEGHRGEREPRPASWVLGADLVYSRAQVEPLLAVLRALRRRAAASGSAAGHGGCGLLLAHKRRNALVTAELMLALRAEGCEPESLDLGTALPDLARRYPAVALWCAPLW